MMKKSENKARLNLKIDAILFILLLGMSALGFLIKFVLIPGYKRNELYGNDVELYFWGLTRHQWGNIHLYLSLLFLLMLTIHIILHWKVIVIIFRKIIPGRTGRLILSSSALIIAISLLLSPLYLNPDIGSFEGKALQIGKERVGFSSINESMPVVISGGEVSPSVSSVSNTEVLTGNHHQHDQELDINGTMTLNDLSDEYNIPAEDMAEAMGIPMRYADERLGRLRRRYSFEIHDLRTFINNKINIDDR